MGDILIRLDGPLNVSLAQNFIDLQPDYYFQEACIVYGKEGTFRLIRNKEDAVVGVGYLCHIDKQSFQESLSDILTSFQESNIGKLKRSLVGQFILLIKRGPFLYIFSDFLGARNIFYTSDKKIISSSFSAIESLLNPNESDVDIDKIFEFVAMRPFYPGWIGRSTINKRIKWLMPYEYIKIDLSSGNVNIESIEFYLENKKSGSCQDMAYKSICILKAIIKKEEFLDSEVGVSITGGVDTRLVAGIVSDKYARTRFRIAASRENLDSMHDLSVAKKLARIQKVPLDIYYFQRGRDDDKYCELTEGFSPVFNKTITPLIDNADRYSIGFGGVYGSELFEPLYYSSIDEFFNKRIQNSKKLVHTTPRFWSKLRDEFFEQFMDIKNKYRVSKYNEVDYIRIFYLLNTARYSSFIARAFNQLGYQLEPYGTFAMLEFALQVAPELLGDSRRTIEGGARVQKAALEYLNSRMAKIIAFKEFRPMLHLSGSTFPYYLVGFILHAKYFLRARLKRYSQEMIKVYLPQGYYLTNGWEANLRFRLKNRYKIKITEHHEHFKWTS